MTLTKKLAKKLAIKLHRKLWNWIADETIRRQEIIAKHDYPLFKRKDISNNCWCCEYAEEECKNCPIIWNEESYYDDLGLRIPECKDEEYGKWREKAMRGNWQEAAHWARIIAELPERDT